MRFTETPLKGSFLIDLEKKEDDRGFFARFYCEREFHRHGLAARFKQANNSLSIQEGTLRGMHYQLPDKQEAKLVRCLKGSFYDVILDLRKDSPTFGQHYGAVLSEKNRTMMYVPEGFAHGFLTLENDSEVFYLVSEEYSREKERGIRWNDPRFNIKWPNDPLVVSERDSSHPSFDPSYHLEG